MRGIYIFCILFFISTQIFSQVAIEWQNTIGGNGSDELQSMQQTTDGGFILGGFSDSNISGDKTENSKGGDDYWIIKVDAFGNIQWQKTIGGDNDDKFTCIQQTTDGGYILGGWSLSNISGDKTENSQGHDYWIVKIDSTGNIQWQNTIGGNGFDQLHSLQQTTDGGYILGGWSLSDISGDKNENCQGGPDYWIVKIDDLGNIQWQNTIGGSNNDFLSSIQQTSDGGYILGGWSLSGISGDKTENSNGNYDYWIVKTDFSGNIQWQNTLGGSNEDDLSSIKQTNDGGYILAGYSKSGISGDKTENSNGNWDYWLVKTDTVGNIQWQNTIGGDSADYFLCIQETSNGGYILGGYSKSNISGDKTEDSNGEYDYWILKTDVAGNIMLQKTIGGNSYDRLNSIQQTANGGYILGGWSHSNISGDKTESSNGWGDYWIVKLSEIIQLFTPTITPSNLILCPNESDTLWTQVYDSYQWYKDGNIIPGANQQFLVVDYFNDSGYYFYVEVDSAGFFETSDSVLVDGWAFLPPFVIQSGNFTIGSMGEMIICPGDTAYLILGNPYDTNIQWTDNGTAIPGANNDTLIITQAGLYHVTGAPSQCPNYVQGLFDNIQVVMGTSPVPTVTPNNLMLCPNETDTLWTQVFGTYQWFKDGILIPGATQQFLVVDQFNDAGSMFSVEVTQNSCAGMSQSVLVDGWAFLPPFVIHEGTFTIGSMGEMLMCPGDTAYLILGQPYEINIQWTDNGNIIPGATNDTLVVTQSGLYHVTGSPAVCPNFVQGLFDDITVIVQGPTTPVITLTGNNLSTQSGYTYQWYLNGNAIAGSTNTIPVQGMGSYTVTITDNNGCSETSAPYIVTSIIESLQSGNVGVIYNNGTLQISRSIANYEEEIFVLDLTGRIVAYMKLAKGISQTEFQLHHINTGIYFVKINDAAATVKFFVE